MEELNIRESYRFEPPIDCEVRGKIIYDGDIFNTETDYKVQNISIGGVGLLVNHPGKGKGNSLINVGIDETFRAEFNLVNFYSMKYEKFVAMVACVVWRNKTFMDKFGYMGTKFITIEQKDEESLYQFIHNGQLRAIRKQHGY